MLARLKLKFTCSKYLLMLTVLVVLGLTGLGMWQLGRAESKRLMIQASQQLAESKPVLVNNANDIKQYQPIKAQGHFGLPILLLDNQHVNHRFGFNVYSPFTLNNGTVLLVDRGWVIGDISRQLFPEVETPSKLLMLSGIAYYPSGGGMLLGVPYEKIDNERFVIEQVNQKLLQNILQKKVYPFIMRMNKNMPFGFNRQWHIVSMQPSRHVAYAFQWFAMATAVVIIFISLAFSRVKGI